MYVNVIVPVPLEPSFTYRVPDEMAERVKVGSRVTVPFGRGRFYTMVRDEGGFMYLRTVGDAILLLSEDVDGSDDSTAMRIKNNRLYFSTAEDYSGTGGTEYVDIVAIVIADGVEYRRTFRVAMIG